MKISFSKLFFLQIILCSIALSNLHSADTNPILNYERLHSTYISQNNPDSVYHYATLIIESGKNSNDTIEVLECYHQSYEYFINNNHYKLASDFLKQFVEYADKSGNETYIAKSYYQTALFFMYIVINEEIALKYYNISLEIWEKTKNHYEIARVYKQLGYYYFTKDKNSSFEYFLKCLKICKENKFYPVLISTYKGIADLYRDSFEDYNMSKKYYWKMRNLSEEQADSSNLAFAYIELGCLDLEYNKLDSISFFYNKSYEIAQEAKDSYMLEKYYRHMSVYYEKLGDYQKALFCLKKVEIYIFEGYKHGIPEPLLKMAELEQKLGNYKKANQHLQKYLHIKDSLDKSKKTNEYAQLELKFELENIEKENTERAAYAKLALQKQKTIRNYLIIFAILLIIILFLIYRNFSSKRLADKAKLNFFTNVSHELRTPLTLILSPLEKLNNELTSTAYSSRLSVMLRNAKTLKKLINQLLDISKIDKTMLNLEKGTYDFSYSLRTVSAMFTSLANDKNINFEFPETHNPLWFSFDKERIEIVLNNLLSNAFKFTPNEGKVIITIIQGPTHLKLKVKDTGIGIPDSETNKIFSRFYQSKTSLNNNFEGTGLGLAIVKEYIELHEGTISVTSQINKGSEFVVNLPLIGYQDSMITKEQQGPELEGKTLNPVYNTLIYEKHQHEKTEILIVEDNLDLRNYLKSIFETAYNVLEAPNGDVAKRIARDENPEIIISDVMMPICDGYCLTEFLKSHIETSHIPIILLTAKTNQRDKIAGYQMGADDYIAKPFDEKELTLKVHNILNTRKKHKEKFKKQITVNPSEIVASSLDEQFLQKTVQAIEENISNSDFSIDQLCTEVGLSRRNMFRKLKALTDTNPSQFIRTIRLKRAAQLLAQKAGSVSEIAFQTGFDDHSYFTKCFKETFHKLPSEYI